MTATYPGSVLDDELDELIETIREAIAHRGFYILTDDRLDLLCGLGCGEKVGQTEVNRMIGEFAARQAAHPGWWKTVTSSGPRRPKELDGLRRSAAGHSLSV